jgi:diadenosine tetraphosphatase ApaH/serine/threonine PP2A family protein phosphatase
VRGNHDDALLGGGMQTSAPIRHALAWTQTQLQQHHRAFLQVLAYSYQEHDATYVHASAASPEEWTYVRSLETAKVCMDAAGTHLCFIGHVHIPVMYYETPGAELRRLFVNPGRVISLADNTRYLINTGSVGQPRDRNNAAAYVIYDDGRKILVFHSVPYDYLSAGKKIRSAGLDSFFAERLALGR